MLTDFTALSALYILQVRASSLQELVYKGGQAGVTKATVTITFDNSEKKQSPLGYESFDEITVSRQVRAIVFNFFYKYLSVSNKQNESYYTCSSTASYMYVPCKSNTVLDSQSVKSVCWSVSDS